MKLPLFLCALLLVGVVVTANGIPTVVTYIPHDKVSETFAKGGNIIMDHGLNVIAQRRTAGEAEAHEKTNHVFIIVEGEATLVTGGTLIDAKHPTPDQIRGSGIQGGETRHVTKGDVITIPARTPHWFKEVPTQTIAYYAINIEP